MRLQHLKPTASLLFVLVAALVLSMTLLSVGREPIFDTLLYGFLSMSLAATGVLVVSRHPQNPIGWVFCGFAVYLALAELAEGWGLRAAEQGLPSGVAGEWVITWSWIGELTVWTIVLLSFPDGKLASRRWRFVPWLAITGCALAVPGQALSPRTDTLFAGGQNPFALEGAAPDLLFGIGIALLLAALLASIVSFGLRLRRARGVERQQLKWFAYAAALVGVVGPFAVIFWGRTILVELAVALSFAALPVAAGIAILRYRLYDIDVVINRTLVYASLTALLTVVYTGGVFVLGNLLSPGEGDSQLAVAASTLAAAALFQPLRRRLQGLVDRRFNRRRYNATMTVSAFSARLRDEVDLDTLSAELLTVLDRTMRPTQVGLWLRR